jgi:cytochrome b
MLLPILSNDRRLVWDLPLRLFHWLLVISIFASWGTAKLGFGWMKWHFWFGYWVIGLLVFRLIWGVVGPRHARFRNFLKRPSKVLAYVRRLAGTAQIEGSVGHNPLGGLMVVVMLGLLAVQACTGLFATDDIAWAGPYNAAVSATAAGRLTNLHHVNFKIIWCAIGLHLLAILYYTWIKKEALVSAMVTGEKPAEAVPPGQTISGSQLWKALGVILLCCVIVYLILREAPSAGAAY